MMITILRNHSWLGDNGIYLSRTYRSILHVVRVVDLGVSTERVNVLDLRTPCR
jgi:hypothetical protein